MLIVGCLAFGTLRLWVWLWVEMKWGRKFVIEVYLSRWIAIGTLWLWVWLSLVMRVW